jgi:chromosome segregation ATPase
VTIAATRPALEGVAGQLGELLASLRSVEAGALERIAAAETAAAEASARATQAEHDRDTAVSRADVADRQRRDAAEASKIADRRARDAEKSAEETQHRAWREIADHDHKRGKAETAAEEAKANLKALKERFDQLADEHDELRKQNKELTRTLTVAEKAQAVAQQAMQTQQDRAVAAEGERDWLAAANGRATEQAAEIERLHGELSAAQARADTAPTHEQIAVLDSFPQDDDQPGMMSPARLRAALGLSSPSWRRSPHP